MARGVVQFFQESKGFGYIRNPESREEIFVHRRHLQEVIKRGDWVTFVVSEDKNGLFATDVRKIPPPGAQRSEEGR